MQNLDYRMKQNYEQPARHYLTRRMPVVVRVDGRTFHNLKLEKPFDYKFIDAMVMAASHLFTEMQGCKIAYIQSDEASFVLTDYDHLDTQAWCNYNKSKVESITAALMSVAFGRCLRLMGHKELVVFDARAFNVPQEEVANYLLWRAKDWYRNSVQMFARSIFSHKELQDRSIPERLTMLSDRGQHWSNLDDQAKHGTFLLRDVEDIVEDIQCGPYYVEVAKLWARVNPLMTFLGTLSAELKPVPSALKSNSILTGSNSGISSVGIPQRNNETKPSKTCADTCAPSSNNQVQLHMDTEKSIGSPSNIHTGSLCWFHGQAVEVVLIRDLSDAHNRYTEALVKAAYGDAFSVPVAELVPRKK